MSNDLESEYDMKRRLDLEEPALRAIREMGYLPVKVRPVESEIVTKNDIILPRESYDSMDFAFVGPQGEEIEYEEDESFRGATAFGDGEVRALECKAIEIRFDEEKEYITLFWKSE